MFFFLEKKNPHALMQLYTLASFSSMNMQMSPPPLTPAVCDLRNTSDFKLFLR